MTHQTRTSPPPQRIRAACPDCTAEAGLVEVAPSVVVLAIYHDPSCPAYIAQVRKRGGME